MSYRACRWYDKYPRIADVLRLIRLLPSEKQRDIGQSLAGFLSNRHVTADMTGRPYNGRWYDNVGLLPQALASLEIAPDSIKEHATDFLIQTIQKSATVA